jgi:hypothetical protein
VSSGDYQCVAAEEKECTQDWQCGQLTKCSGRKLQEPVCSSGVCDSIDTTVACCNDIDCPDGSYCNNQYKCSVKPAEKNACPYQCCIGDEAFFDRKCATASPVCCADGSCKKTATECAISGGGGTQKQDECGWWIPNVLPDLLCKFNQWLAGVWGYLLVIGVLLIIVIVAIVVLVLAN